MKKLIISLLLLLTFNSTSYSQSNNKIAIDSDHLLPLRPAFGVFKKHNQKIQSILFNGISDFQFTQFLTYGAESVLVIELDTSNISNPYFSIVYHTCKSSIWASLIHKDSKEIIVEKFRKPISKIDAIKIADLYSAALSKVCESNRTGIDGNSYQFATMTHAGTAWIAGKPNAENKVDRLVLLNNELIELIKNDQEIFSLNGELSMKIEKLTQEFN
ncbi:MAG: hypothetical protein EBR30_19450 [Cytophagia bacterium]|nr:hypothetical protein [Cytophagia bacterium]